MINVPAINTIENANWVTTNTFLKTASDNFTAAFPFSAFNGSKEDSNMAG